MLLTLLSAFQKSGQVLLGLLPYVVLGILLAEILKYTPWTRLVRRAMVMKTARMTVAPRTVDATPIISHSFNAPADVPGIIAEDGKVVRNTCRA